jgi:ferric-dicitrate binding protein FerR (iron transport regulator)
METTIKKYLEGKASETEMRELLRWLTDEEKRTAFKNYKDNWKANPGQQRLPRPTLLELSKFQSAILKEQHGKIRSMSLMQRWYQYAAILFLLFALGSVYLYFSAAPGKPEIYNSIVFAETGQIAKTLLPDSTLVWLNSGSRLKYDNRFGIQSRRVELTGQAYFDVTHNKSLPFIVNCNEIQVKVLGTRFSAEAYPEGQEIQVVLEEGEVELLNGKNEKTFARLRPNEMLVYEKRNNHFNISEVVSGKYTAWRDGTIHIYDQPLNVVAIKLQKRYNQPIVVDDALSSYKVTFSIRDEDFSEILEMLLTIAPAKAYQEGDTIYLKKK